MTSFVADDDLAQALAEMDIPTFDDFNESDDDDAPLTSKEVSLYADSPPSPSPSTFPVAHLYKSVYSQSYSRTPTQTSAIESLVREMGFEGYLSSHPTNSYGGTRPQSPTDEERDTISELLTGAPLTPTHSNSNSNSNSIAHPTISHILTTKSQSQQNNNLSERVILHRGSLKKRGTQSTIKKTNWREVIVFSDGVIVCKDKKGNHSSKNRSDSSTAQPETDNNNNSVPPTLSPASSTSSRDSSRDTRDSSLNSNNSLEFKQFEPLSACRIIDLGCITSVENVRYLKILRMRKEKKEAGKEGESDEEEADDSSSQSKSNVLGALKKGIGGGASLLRNFGGSDANTSSPSATSSSSSSNSNNGGVSVGGAITKTKRTSMFGLRNKLKEKFGEKEGTVPMPIVEEGSTSSLPLSPTTQNDTHLHHNNSEAFEILTPTRSYQFVAESKEEKDRWVNLLGAAAVLSREFYRKQMDNGKGNANDIANDNAKDNDIIEHNSWNGGGNLFDLHKLSYADIVERRLPGWPHLISMNSGIFTAAVVGDCARLKAIVKSVAALELELDLNSFDEFGYTALHYATIHSNLSFAAALLDYGASPNSSTTATQLRTPLFFAVASCNLKMVHLLIANGGEVLKKDVVGRTPIHMIVCNGENAKNSPKIISVLRSMGARQLDKHNNTRSNGKEITNAMDGGGDTPLHACAVKGLPRMIQALCNEGGNPNTIRPSDGLTALQLACAKPFSKTPTAAQSDSDPQMFNVEIIRNLISCGSYVNLPDGNGHTPLYILVAGEHSQLLVAGEEDALTLVLNEQWFFSVFMGVKELIKAGARVNEELFAMLPSGMAEPINSFILEWTHYKIEIDELVKYARHLFVGVVGKDEMVPDNSSAVCLCCANKFSSTNRRHHCRKCGVLACSSCTNKKLPVFAPNSDKQERVCDGCFNTTVGHLAELQSQANDRAKIMKAFDQQHQNSKKGKEEEDRSELFEGAADSDEDSDDEFYRKGRGGASGGANANDAIAEAMQNMNKRGDKLAQIGDKSEMLKDAASEFSQMAKQLRVGQEKKASRWGF